MILVFAGAGASYSVDCKQYPTTVEFFRRLPEEITNNPWFAAASQFLDSRENGEPVDIEKLLGVLSDMKDYCEASIDTNEFPGWMLWPGHDRLKKISPKSRSNLDSGHHRILVDTLREDKSLIEGLRDEINALVYRLYAEEPRPKKLETWAGLLSVLLESHQVVQVFTTNYDLVLESVISEGGLDNRIATGRDRGRFRTRLDLAYWDPDNKSLSGEKKVGLLTKLHGSVDWQRGNNSEIIMGPPRFSEVHDNHIILYPGHKGEPIDEPFITFHRHLRSVAQAADAAIFIGYSFRDEHINSILSNFLDRVPTYVIDIEPEPPNQGFLHSLTHFSGGFTRDSVRACIQILSDNNLIA